MLPRFARTVARVTRPTEITERGSMRLIYDGAPQHDITGCFSQPGTSSETPNDGRNDLRVDVTLFLPAGADVQRSDRVTIPTGTFTIIGEPNFWQSPSGLLDHVEAQLSRYRG
jgi:hypothetical protein